MGISSKNDEENCGSKEENYKIAVGKLPPEIIQVPDLEKQDYVMKILLEIEDFDRENGGRILRGVYITRKNQLLLKSNTLIPNLDYRLKRDSRSIG